MSRSLDKDPLYQNLLFSLPMREGSGTVATADVAKPHHPVAMTHSPAWVQVGPQNLWVLDFNSAHPDTLICLAASCVDLGFTTSDFSGNIWAYPDDAVTRYLMIHGSPGTDGWDWSLSAGLIQLRTSAPAASSYCNASTIPSTTWSNLGFSRSGASVRVYWNGRDVTDTPAAHANPTASPARDLVIGAREDGATSPFDGKLWNPRIWGRALKPEEHRQIFDRERRLFGV